MYLDGIVTPEEAAILTAVLDVHCRERGIDPSSDEAGQIADVVVRLFNSGTNKPDDIRAALISRFERDGAQTPDEPAVLS